MREDMRFMRGKSWVHGKLTESGAASIAFGKLLDRADAGVASGFAGWFHRLEPSPIGKLVYEPD